jgi:hypothetical protein
MVVKRVQYFEEPLFIECFSPHPDYQFTPPVSRTVEGVRPFIDKLEAAARGQKLAIAKWLIEPGSVTEPGQPVAEIERVPPDNRNARIMAPCSGKVSETAASKLPSGQFAIPDGPLFTLKTYSANGDSADPFQELRAACDALNTAAQRHTAPSAAVTRRVAAPAAAARPAAVPWYAKTMTFGVFAIFFLVCVAIGVMLSILGIELYEIVNTKQFVNPFDDPGLLAWTSAIGLLFVVLVAARVLSHKSKAFMAGLPRRTK